MNCPYFVGARSLDFVLLYFKLFKSFVHLILHFKENCSCTLDIDLNLIISKHRGSPNLTGGNHKYLFSESLENSAEREHLSLERKYFKRYHFTRI